MANSVEIEREIAIVDQNRDRFEKFKFLAKVVLMSEAPPPPFFFGININYLSSYVGIPPPQKIGACNVTRVEGAQHTVSDFYFA